MVRLAGPVRVRLGGVLRVREPVCAREGAAERATARVRDGREAILGGCEAPFRVRLHRGGTPRRVRAAGPRERGGLRIMGTATTDSSAPVGGVLREPLWVKFDVGIVNE
uniref:Uncharacterized protein n=1 Tax=Opuntia streptacantha TaxID=393608 RepID=A0A7C9CUB9_OPUST